MFWEGHSRSGAGQPSTPFTAGCPVGSGVQDEGKLLMVAVVIQLTRGRADGWKPLCVSGLLSLGSRRASRDAD